MLPSFIENSSPPVGSICSPAQNGTDEDFGKNKILAIIEGLATGNELNELCLLPWKTRPKKKWKKHCSRLNCIPKKDMSKPLALVSVNVMFWGNTVFTDVIS